LTGSLDLSASRGQLGLFVLGLSHGSLLSLLLFLLTKLALFHLLFEGLETSFRGLALLGEVIFLLLSIFPI
jgi:hypothetical protein